MEVAGWGLCLWLPPCWSASLMPGPFSGHQPAVGIDFHLLEFSGFSSVQSLSRV